MSVFFMRLWAVWALRSHRWHISYWAVLTLLGLLALLRQLAVIAVVVLHWAHTTLAEAAGPLVAAVDGHLPTDGPVDDEVAGDGVEDQPATRKAIAERLDRPMASAGTR